MLSKGYIPVWLLFLAVSFCLNSCNNSALLEEIQPIEKYQWEYNHKKTFKVNVTDTTQRYNLHILLRHSFNYEWRNLWIKIETKFPDGRTLSKRMNLQLCEADGEWFGKCLGDNCDMEFLIQRNAVFPQAGEYTFSFTQDMRVNPINYIKGIGMRIEKVKKD